MNVLSEYRGLASIYVLLTTLCDRVEIHNEIYKDDELEELQDSLISFSKDISTRLFLFEKKIESERSSVN